MDHYSIGIGIAIGMIIFHFWLLINDDSHLR